MLQLYLVRHGQTAWNALHRFQGHSDVPLDEIGRAQSRRLAQRLQSEPIRHVFCSDLIRARETAESIASVCGCPLTVTPLLREACFGAWEGLTRADIEERFPGKFEEYLKDSVNCRPPGAETSEEIRARILQTADHVRTEAPEGVALVVGHGGSLRWIIIEALNAPAECYRRLRVDNASLSMVEYQDDRSWLALFNDVGHLGGLLSDVTISVNLNQ